ncbi:photosystem I assembly protein Ycf3 [Abditibacteriota bacterium]|nr:photosystem I assembly protein Ycf3 [Abditibacteriota bacterium]
MPLPQTLRDKLKARQVVPFVGAGVSMAVTDKDTGARLFPSWGDLLKAAEEKLRSDNKTEADLVAALLNDGDYLGAAGWAEEGLKGQLPSLIKQQVDKTDEQVEEGSLELARLTWQLGNSLVITTNYDRVLEWACPHSGNCKRLLNRSGHELTEIQRGTSNRETVWHLHGQIDDADSLILTPESYARLYSNTKKETEWQSALETLRHIMTAKSLLFIGYGMGDIQIIEQLQQIGNIFGGAPGPHYVLGTPELVLRVRGKKLPVEPISYETHGEPLLELLREMAKEVGVVSVGATTSATVIPTVADFDPKHPSFNVPYRQKGDQVLGREEQLNEVRRQLTAGKRTSIGQTASFRGIGGLGKTQLAVEYAYKFRDQYPYGVVWIKADGNIDSQLTELAQDSCWVSPQSEHNVKLDIALHRIRSYSDYLLIFDNVEKVEDIKPYLPEPSANPHILTTSRLPLAGFTAIPLSVLSPEIGLELLLQEASRRTSNNAETEAARKIVNLLGNLPLAIELAGAFIDYCDIGWQQYLDLLQNDFKEATPPDALSSFTEHEANLYHTLHVNEALFDKEPLLHGILDTLMWGGPAPMGTELLAHLLDVKPVQLTTALSLGVTLRLLQETSDFTSYAVHRLVRQVRQTEIPLSGRIVWGQTIAQRLGGWFESKREDFTCLPEFEREIEHLTIWQEQSEQVAPQECSRLLWLQAYPPFHRGRYTESKLIIERALQIYRTTANDNRELEAHLLSDMSNLEYRTGNYTKLLEYGEQALAIRREVLGERHPNTATSLSNMGNAYHSLGQSIKALEFYEQALAIRREVLGERHSDTATSLSNMGNAYRGLGQHDKALGFYEQALAIQCKVLGERHPNTAISLSNMGNAYRGLGQSTKALEFYEQALAIRREVLGERHPNTAISLNNMGNAYRGLGQHGKALEFYEQALAIQREALGEYHPNTATSLNNMGAVHWDEKDFSSALEKFRQAYSIQSEMLGKLHPNTLITLVWWVSTLEKLERYVESFGLLDSTLSELPESSPDFKFLEEKAVRILPNAQGNVEIEQATLRYKNKWCGNGT